MKSETGITQFDKYCPLIYKSIKIYKSIDITNIFLKIIRLRLTFMHKNITNRMRET